MFINTRKLKEKKNKVSDWNSNPPPRFSSINYKCYEIGGKYCEVKLLKFITLVNKYLLDQSE